MFKLFKKNTTVTEEAELLEVPEQVINTKELIEQIHSEFNIAGELLLKSAKETINRCNVVNIDKGERLAKLGFSQTAEAQTAVKAKNDRDIAQEKARSIEYFSIHYPNNKFIDEEAVNRICKKYNLVQGKLSAYKGFVPEKNLTDIEAFKLKTEDYKYLKVYYGYSSFVGSYENITEINKREYDRYTDRSNPMYNHSDRNETFEIQKEKFSICAPIRDMKLEDNEEVKNYKIVAKHIPDPVVLQAVKGGYLIVTAWGDEASDDEIVNHKMN